MVNNMDYDLIFKDWKELEYIISYLGVLPSRYRIIEPHKKVEFIYGKTYTATFEKAEGKEWQIIHNGEEKEVVDAVVDLAHILLERHYRGNPWQFLKRNPDPE